MQLTTIILAAGKGTRMKSDLPKVLHTLCGDAMITYPVRLAQHCRSKNINLVVSRNHHHLKEHLKQYHLKYVIQHPPRGTGHAIICALKKIKQKSGNILILSGDMPLVKEETVKNLINTHQKSKAVLTFVTGILKTQNSFGRIVRDKSGCVESIVEFKDANPNQKKIQEVNVAVYLAEINFLRSALKKLKPANQQKEYYLTDIIKIAYNQKTPAQTVFISQDFEIQGVNNQEELSMTNNIVLTNHIKKLLAEGVQIIKPESIVLDNSVKIKSGTQLMGPLYLKGKTSIGKNCIIEPGCFLKDTLIKDNSHIKANTYTDSAEIGSFVTIGPMAHLRPGTKLKDKTKAGNFVEIKKSTINENSKINHLTYIGDATIGKNVNVGAGTITCNFDGKNKFQTILEDNVFVGSNTQFVAPVKIGKNAVIGAGSTITKNVNPDSLALSRSHQTEIKNWSKRK